MHPSELQLGDIICFTTSSGEPDHIAMYTGIIHGKHYVTHSIINDTPGLQTTILKDDRRRMDVFRPVNAELGVRAAQRLLAWAKYRVPYDSRRANLMIEVTHEINIRALRQDQQEKTDYILNYFSQVARTKFYERIKFAARRDTCPVKMLDGVQARGFTCVQAVILAYQAEELVPYVKTLEEIKNELASLSTTIEQISDAWISDKDCSRKIIEMYDLPKSYEKHAASLRSSMEFSGFCIKNKRTSTFVNPNYHPSLVAWNFAKEPCIDLFIKNFDSCLDLPAKICNPGTLLLSMQKNPRHWVSVGSLENNLLPITFSPEEIERHRIRKANLELEVASNRSQIYRVNPILLTSFLSPKLETFFVAKNLPTRSLPPIVSSARSINGIEAQEKDESRQLESKVFSPLIARKYPKKSPD